MEKDLSKIDPEKNSNPTQKHKNNRHPTPIKHRPSLNKEIEEMDLDDKQTINTIKSDDTKLESSATKTQNKRAQSFPNGFYVVIFFFVII